MIDEGIDVSEDVIFGLDSRFRYFFGKKQKGSIRSYRISIKKNKSNLTKNFGLYDCELSFLEVKELMLKIIAEHTYFNGEIVFSSGWRHQCNLHSHFIIVHDFRISPTKSICFGIDLHDFDLDEIKHVLFTSLCNVK